MLLNLSIKYLKQFFFFISKDEHSPNKPSASNNSYPLDFLTKLINKSAGNDLPAAAGGGNAPLKSSPTAVTAASTALPMSTNATASSSANLSYLVDSLKKFVNTGTTSANANNTNSNTHNTAGNTNTNSTYVSQQSGSSGGGGVAQFYDHPLNSQNSFIQQRSATPTKDELYQHAGNKALLTPIKVA